MGTFHRLILATAALAAGCGQGNGDTAPPAAAVPAVVAVTAGLLQGSRENDADAYQGIPYAAPPVGELRWAPPQPVAHWAGVREAKTLPPPCPQTPASDDGSSGSGYQGVEDCLYLNVWTPAARTPGDRLPVMFFIHGGGNFAGSTAESIDFILNTSGGPAWYDGSRLAARGNVVVVTANYRLGPLGFIRHAAMRPANTGNFGLLDQVAALEWVQENIAVFGGDSGRVMIFGESGGAYNVCALMTSPLARGLFARALMQSGVCYLHPESLMEQYTDDLLQEVGCSGAPDVMQCLRDLPAEDLILAQSAQPKGLGSFTFHPFIDGYFALDQPLAVLARGEHNRVPFVIGSNAAEYAHRFENVTTELIYRTTVAQMVGVQHVDAALQMYPVSDYASPREAMVQVMSDRNITCTARKIARQVSAVQGEPVYRYHFRRILSAPERHADGAYHGSELLYVFQHMDGVHFFANDDDRVVESHLLHYWTQFAAGGDPNGANLPFWQEYDPVTDPYQILDVVPAGDVLLKDDKCSFWDNLF
ncbi:MAG TPA: carboxylesterase family protein [Acidiferrobacterales bacterium]